MSRGSGGECSAHKRRRKMGSQASEGLGSNHVHHGFIQKAEHFDDLYRLERSSRFSDKSLSLLMTQGNGRRRTVAHLGDLGSTDKFCERLDVVETPLRVRVSHRRVQPVDRSPLSRMVPTTARGREIVEIISTFFLDGRIRDPSFSLYSLLRTRYRMQIEVDPQAVLSTPLERLEEIWCRRACDMTSLLRARRGPKFRS